jgi:hypothetical protein
LSGPLQNAGQSIDLRRARQACPLPCRRDLLVRSVAKRWTIHRSSAGTTSVPLALSEGPACQVRCKTLDNPSFFGGHDERAPPIGVRHAHPSIVLIAPPTNLPHTRCTGQFPRQSTSLSAESLIFGGPGPLALEVFECMMTKTLCQYSPPCNEQSCPFPKVGKVANGEAWSSHDVAMLE